MARLFKEEEIIQHFKERVTEALGDRLDIHKEGRVV